ncbi:MAG TPA: hypothetical protein VFB03_03530 [Candidatus Saccharimonadales bacterium]|nr:hypothetical protein [Candidatus Saccharimonadales bacterium]
MTKNFYIHGRPFYANRQKKVRWRRRLVGMVAFLALAVIGLIIYDILKNRNFATPPVSREVHKQIGSEQTYGTDYFQFTDNTDVWKLGKNTKPGSIYYFLRYHQDTLEHSLTVYINQTPIPLYLAVPRVLPLTIVSGNEFNISHVSDPCGTTYKQGKLHRVQEVSLGGTSMLCDPDASQYDVVFGQIGGNYNLDLTRKDGSKNRYVIIYKNLKADPNSNVVEHIAKTFKAL